MTPTPAVRKGVVGRESRYHGVQPQREVLRVAFGLEARGAVARAGRDAGPEVERRPSHRADREMVVQGARDREAHPAPPSLRAVAPPSNA